MTMNRYIYLLFTISTLSSFGNRCEKVSKHRIIRELALTKFYFYNDSIYVNKSLLSDKVTNTIRGGVFVNYHISDSSKIIRKVIMPLDKEIFEVSGNFVIINDLSYVLSKNQKKIYFYDDLFSR